LGDGSHCRAIKIHLVLKAKGKGEKCQKVGSGADQQSALRVGYVRANFRG
jgi:hypothetical protein